MLLALGLYDRTPNVKSGTKLERILDSGQFAVTAEAGPPRGASAEVIQRKGDLLKSCCDAVNVTDNQAAVVRMASLAGCLILKGVGVEPVLQMVVRDRNRLALQSDLLGAAALGVKNVLCLSGDHQRLGNHPTARGVYDIDSTHLIQLARTMRDEHRLINGDEITGELPFYIGAAANPFAGPVDFRVVRLAKKVSAGVDFIQTQPIFDLPRFFEWLRCVVEKGLDEKVRILAGVTPLKSVSMARHIRDRISGLTVPQSVVDRLKSASDEAEEGVKICVETIGQLREAKGVHGVHVMAIAWEDIVPRLVKEAGLLPRPTVEAAGR